MAVVFLPCKLPALKLLLLLHLSEQLNIWVRYTHAAQEAEEEEEATMTFCPSLSLSLSLSLSRSLALEWILAHSVRRSFFT